MAECAAAAAAAPPTEESKGLAVEASPPSKDHDEACFKALAFEYKLLEHPKAYTGWTTKSTQLSMPDTVANIVHDVNQFFAPPEQVGASDKMVHARDAGDWLVKLAEFDSKLQREGMDMVVARTVQHAAGLDPAFIRRHCEYFVRFSLLCARFPRAVGVAGVFDIVSCKPKCYTGFSDFLDKTSVYDYLASRGIAADLVTFVGNLTTRSVDKSLWTEPQRAVVTLASRWPWRRAFEGVEPIWAVAAAAS